MVKFGIVTFLAVFLSAPAVAEKKDAIVFSGGDVAITYDDIERYIVENTPPDPAEKAEFLSRPGIYREMAQVLYTLQVLTSEAERLPDFDQVQADWAKQLLYKRRQSKQYREQYVAHMLKDVNWEATAKEAYMVEKDSYMTEETVNASHILINAGEARSDDEAIALATQLRQRALQGEDFAELAREHSEDRSAARNAGNLGFFKRGQMVPAFETAAFAMDKPGAISELVKTPFGYHIIQFHSRKMPAPMPFDDVKDKIITQLQAQMEKRVWQDKLTAIRSATDIAVDETLIKELQDKYRTKGKPGDR